MIFILWKENRDSNRNWKEIVVEELREVFAYPTNNTELIRNT
jgi:hypothetical protein